MSLKVWINGKLVDKADAKVGVYDHGLLYGDGIFEGIRVYNGKVFECEAHLRRLFASARAIRLNIPLTHEQLKAAIEQTFRANGFTDCYVRLVVTRGEGCLGLNPNKCANASTFIITDSIELYSKEMYENGMAVIVSSVTRNHPNAMSPRIKSLNYLNNILAKIEAVDAGVPEAIMLNHNGTVAECTGDNIFVVRDGKVLTPGITDGILEGVTRDIIMKLCARLSIPFAQCTIERHDLYIADECFLTGTAAELVAVTSIDHRPVGAGKLGPVTRRLSEAFRSYVRES